ncbi:MAG TPA: hypothetical protein VL282_19435 [Tepidisphaeraceae bacterium]|nr:hypothetical protein [Tepidisphaeraceae bacterium]
MGCQTQPSEHDGSALYATTYHALSPICLETDGLSADNIDLVFESELGRFSLSQFDATGKLTAMGAVGSGSAKSAVIVNDFLKYRTYPLAMVVSRDHTGTTEANTHKSIHVRSPAEFEALNATTKGKEEIDFIGVVPVYIGVGVRILADVSEIKGDVNFASLPALAVAAATNRARGTISVGAMGISGKSMGLLIQQPVALNDATVQTALQSVGAIKASLAAVGEPESDRPQAFRLRPVVMGFELSERRPEYINAIRDFIYGSAFMLSVMGNTGSQNVHIEAISMNVYNQTLLERVNSLYTFAKGAPLPDQDMLAIIAERHVAKELGRPVWRDPATKPTEALQRFKVIEQTVATQEQENATTKMATSMPSR